MYNIFETVLVDTCCRAVNEKNLFLTEKNDDLKKNREKTILSYLESIQELSLEVNKKFIKDLQIIFDYLHTNSTDNELLLLANQKAQQLSKYYRKEGGVVRAA